MYGREQCALLHYTAACDAIIFAKMQINANQLDELAALMTLDEVGSFVGAGRALERHPSVISKRIAALEVRLGVRLVERSTRNVRLTEPGLRLAESVRAANMLLHEAQEEASRGAKQLKGRLRIALPGAMGRLWLSPLLPAFLALYPAIQLEVDYSDRYVDIIGEGFDAAVRVGVLSDSRLVATKLGLHKRIVCASPDYLSRYGVPTDPLELVEHKCLEFEGFANFPEWHLTNGQRNETVTARGPMRSNDSQGLLDAARAGVGILGAGEWLVAADLADGRLVRILPDWAFDTEGGIYIVTSSKKRTSARLDAFIAWTRQQFGLFPNFER